ncbi:Multicopper oxidase [Seminavis robusta]|uniref:Multicopper oxidase n=1 Tax=Seminavis robusta TaxID=568900 RepID=A0A9N8EVX1_9STRA|nr:Multicopper oxidase [Seminavis robusta]|eukprot:Sro1845_g301290.1 Multicopper oxidase (300) ;mRNA; f:14295-15298
MRRIPLLLFLTILHVSNAFFVTNTDHCTKETALHSVVDDIVDSSRNVLNDEEPGGQKSTITNRAPHLIFPGGGLFFYWQAGAVTYMREQGYDLSKVTASGASAGALTAALMATDVDFYKATDRALQLSERAGIWDRSGGLQGIWGDLIYEWLDDLLPENAVEMASDGKLSLLVTPIPSFGKTRVSSWKNRKELIKCCMTSVHLPWFLDGKLTANYCNQPHIDGSFLAKAPDYLPEHRRPSSILRLDWNRDPALAEGEFFDFVKVISPEGIWNILETGKVYAKLMDERGKFKRLPKIDGQ